MDDLNTRAAKLLGCDLRGKNYYHIEDISEIILPFVTPRSDYHSMVLISELQFTISYDWSNILVKHILNIKIQLYDKSIINRGRDMMMEIYSGDGSWWYEKNPEEITRLCVEKLEDELILRKDSPKWVYFNNGETPE